jgi:hypothetical protein
MIILLNNERLGDASSNMVVAKLIVSTRDIGRREFYIHPSTLISYVGMGHHELHICNTRTPMTLI